VLLFFPPQQSSQATINNQLLFVHRVGLSIGSFMSKVKRHDACGGIELVRFFSGEFPELIDKWMSLAYFFLEWTLFFF
jgi:hypothetical protein